MVTLVTTFVCGGGELSNRGKPVLGWKVWLLGISEVNRYVSSQNGTVL